MTPIILPLLDARIPPWDHQHLEQRTCPFCGSRGEEKFIRPDLLHVRHCASCGTFFISPAPSAEALSTFYARYYADHRKAELQLYKDDPSLVKEMLAMNPLADIKVREIARNTTLQGAHALDVGFGLGLTLVLLRKLGANVTGIDLDPDAVAFARNHLGIADVRQSDIMDLQADELFDVITLHDVIEHPLDPMGLLRRAHSLLAPRGVLSIWTPNGSSLLDEVAPIQLRVDLEHMQYLSLQTCSIIAQRLGFTVVHFEALGEPRLESIARLSGADTGGWKKRVRGVVKNIPGFARLNALRKELVAPDARKGKYHLFCLMKRVD